MCLSIGGSLGGLREHLVGYTKNKIVINFFYYALEKTNYVSSPQCPGLITLHESN